MAFSYTRIILEKTEKAVYERGFEYAKKQNPDFLKILRERRKMDEEIESNLNIIIDAYVSEVESKRVVEEKQDVDIIKNIGRDVFDEATSKKA